MSIGNNGGRPTDYTQEKAHIICSRLIDGESLRKICKADDMPNKCTVFVWLRDNKEFQDQYACARREQADGIFDDMLDIADDSANDYMTGEDGHERVNQEAIQRARLRIDARKWVLGKMQPKKYGEKIDIGLSGAVTHKNIEVVLKEDIKDDDIGFIDS